MQSEIIHLCYIAFPYTHTSRERVELNVQAATYLGQLVVEMGMYPVLPTRNSYNMDIWGGDNGYTKSVDFWLESTEQQLLTCDAAIFGHGWDNSYGCRQEMQTCIENAIPAFTDVRDLRQWNDDIKNGTIRA